MKVARGIPQVPPGSGCRKVSGKVENFLKEIHYFFHLESTKKKVLKRVCNWLKNLRQSWRSGLFGKSV